MNSWRIFSIYVPFLSQLLVFTKVKPLPDNTVNPTLSYSLNQPVINVSYLKSNLESLHSLRLEVSILHFYKCIQSDCVHAIFLPLTQRELVGISASIQFQSRRMTVSEILSKNFHGTYPSNLLEKDFGPLKELPAIFYRICKRLRNGY